MSDLFVPRVHTHKQITLGYVGYYLPVSCRSLVDRYDSFGSCKPQILILFNVPGTFGLHLNLFYPNRDHINLIIRIETPSKAQSSLHCIDG